MKSGSRDFLEALRTILADAVKDHAKASEQDGRRRFMASIGAANYRKHGLVSTLTGTHLLAQEIVPMRTDHMLEDMPSGPAISTDDYVSLMAGVARELMKE